MLRFFKAEDRKCDIIGLLQNNELKCALMDEAKLIDCGLEDLLKPFSCKAVLPDRDILFFEIFGPKQLIGKDNKYPVILVLSVRHEAGEGGKAGEYELSVLKLSKELRWERKGQFALVDSLKKSLLARPVAMVVNYVDRPNPIQVIIFDALLAEAGSSVGTGEDEGQPPGALLSLGALAIETKLTLSSKLMTKVLDPADNALQLESPFTLDHLQLHGVRCEALMLGNPSKPASEQPDPCCIKLRLPQFQALVTLEYKGAFAKENITLSKTVYNR